MPFRATFDCLWCGRHWETRAPDDLEGWALLCAECVGSAGDNGFRRARLKAGLAERAAAGMKVAALGAVPDGVERDDWYLRRGRFSKGPIDDLAWQMDLDAATLWLDGLPLGGQIVELAAGTGWWSPLLAGKGELWIYDASQEALEKARQRLVAHGLRAHLHTRDPWAEPELVADAFFCASWLSRVPSARLTDFLAHARRWLKPGGRFAFIEPVAELRLALGDLQAALLGAGFRDAAVSTTSRFFALGTAVAGEHAPTSGSQGPMVAV